MFGKKFVDTSKLTRKRLFHYEEDGMFFTYYQDPIGNLMIESHSGSVNTEPNISFIPFTQLDAEQCNFLRSISKNWSNNPV
ncbi:hypothetical protein P4679_26085 [Priestia megaterium]|uniref:hypothetical protein n=1 Tax=Priestia megaterium TaxID=1404 RepID=UPI002E1D031E|nr:hypothetical protein [Priestia megaterium]